MRTNLRGMVLGFVLLVLCVLGPVGAAERGNLLVDVFRKLLLIQPDGVQRTLAEQVVFASLSPDGRYVAFTDLEQNLTVVNLSSGAKYTLVKLSAGAVLGEIGWAPDGTAVAYLGVGSGARGGFFLVPFPSERRPIRRLGPWEQYQGFSFSPDGSKIVHAVNVPSPGVEILDLATGRPELVHKAAGKVWEAKFSPDGQFIAYRMTIAEPPRGSDDCVPPTIGLRLYSLRERSNIALPIRSAPRELNDIKSFDWSPDGKQIVVTLGEIFCDFPGGASSIFLTTLDLRSQTRISASNLAIDPLFSPDGTAVAYVDYSDSPSRLFRYDLSTGTTVLIRRAEQDAFYRLTDWK